MKKSLIISLVLISVAAFGGSEEGIRLEVVVSASVDEVWDAWTTVEGVKSFFAPDARIDLRPDGPYEIFFDPSAPAGKRGADDMRVMLVQPKSALAFTWNAPEKFPNARGQRTHVMVRLVPETPARTRVILVHDGFGDGEEWNAVRSYFKGAWGGYVLPRLVKRFEKK